MILPMLAALSEPPLDDPQLAYEPKYDGIRAIASIEPPDGILAGAAHSEDARVRLWSRLGNEKTLQFPEIAAALRQWSERLDRPVVLDGEIVALDDGGEPVGFQNLQGRIHVKSPGPSGPAAYIVFDLLRDGDDDVRAMPLRDRRRRLEHLLNGSTDPRLRISEQAVGDGGPLHARAHAGGWEGLIAKRLDAPYASGRRSPDWRKLKLVRRQVCVVGGWTAPRGSRPLFGALLLGVYDERGRLQYVGHSGAGFTDAELGRVWKQLHAIPARVSPFATTPRTNAPPHWVQPRLVAEVKFTEWTADDKLRHPTYVGLRDDIAPETVRREPDTVMRSSSIPPHTRGVSSAQPRTSAAARRRGETHGTRAARGRREPALSRSVVANVLEQLDAIEAASGNGTLELPAGERLEVSNLRKIFWPALKLTKGDLFRHYVRMAPFILPVLADRPLVMKRYPNGVDAKPFYQHRAPDKRPPGVRVEQATSETETRPHLIGGSLTTLLYTVQLGAISQDPWFSRVQAEDVMDHAAIDLDPPDGLPFARVLDVARWVREELEILKTPSFVKTSGSSGMHIYIPMPPDTTYDAGLLFCQIVATVVARKHPAVATVERSLKSRGKRVYVDYLQNVRGKTLASAYSVRANSFAGVSMPVTWEEVEEGVSPQDFTIRTAPARLDAVGDLWARLRRSKGADLRAVIKYAEP